MSTVSARSFAHLKAVFGDCVPKQNAAAMLESSPVAPTNPAELQALRTLVVELAGTKLARVAPSSTQARSLPSGAMLQLGQLQAVRELRSSDGLLKVLTEKRATALFDTIAAMKDVPHTFLEEGCFHRSHVVAKRLEEAGIFCEKIFTIPTSGDLIMETPKAKLDFSVGIYHEAVVVHVARDDGSGVERRVLDPSMGDKPLRVDEWLATMHPSPVTPMGEPIPAAEQGGLETFFLPRFAYGLSDRNAPPTTWSEKDLASAFKWNDEWKVVQKDYEDGGFYDELPKLAGKRAGKLAGET